jgi:hypothetical protein
MQKGELMSVLIKDMEKPKSCFEIIDGDFEYCPFVNTDDDCVLLLKKGICNATWKEQYSKCPLVETPEPCKNDAAKRLSDLIFDINPDEICEQIKSGDLKNWCVTTQTEMRMAMIQLPCWEREKNDE